MSRLHRSQTTLIVPADQAAARLVRLVASAIATDIGLEGDALDDVRLVAGELADSLVRTSDGELVIQFRVEGDEMLVFGDAWPPSERPVLVDAELLQHADIVGARTRHGRGHFDVIASAPVDSSADAGLAPSG